MKKYMFRRTYDRLMKRLEEIKKKRIMLIEEIEKAAQFGDLRENAEFDSAMEIQGQLNREAELILSKLINVEFIDDLKISDEKVSIGTVVELIDIENPDNKFAFSIVGCIDDESPEGTIKVTNASNVAKKLIGKTIGDLVTNLGQENMTAEITAISRVTDYLNEKITIGIK